MAAFDIPPFANSAMDGYAVRTADFPNGTARLIERGTSFAGHPYRMPMARGECVRIFTGAAIPQGADAVIMQEEASHEDGRVCFDRPPRYLENIRRAGDEMTAGSVLLREGNRLAPADLGLLASAGISQVAVRKRVRVSFFSTGDELSPLGAPLCQGMIYDSNRYALGALLEQPFLDPVDLGVVRDDPRALREALEQAAADSDAIITTGGVSVGDADYVTRILSELGHVDFWKIAVKPGKPFAFGSVGGASLFGLPGNPVAVMVVFHELVRPALLRMAGATAPPSLRLNAICQSSLRKAPGRMEFQRGIFEQDDNGELRVTACASQGSHQLSGLSQANCFIVLPAEIGPVRPGQRVSIEPYSNDW